MTADELVKYLNQRSKEIFAKKTGEDKIEKSRSTLAILFIVLFFCVIFLTFFIGFNTTDFGVQEYKDLLTTVSSILSGPLGFIIGFYFKERAVSKAAERPTE
jgi:uncharacterized membrane protein